MLGPLQGWVSMFPYAKAFPLLTLATFLVDHHAAIGKPLKVILLDFFVLLKNDRNDLTYAILAIFLDKTFVTFVKHVFESFPSDVRHGDVVDIVPEVCVVPQRFTPCF